MREQRLHHALCALACSIREFDGIPQAGRECGGNNQQRGNQYFFHRSALPTFEFAAAATLEAPAAATSFSPTVFPARARDRRLRSEQNLPSRNTAEARSRYPGAARVEQAR